MKAVCIFVMSFAVALLGAASMQAQTVTGSGSAGTIPIWTGRTTIGKSIITQTTAGDIFTPVQVGIGIQPSTVFQLAVEDATVHGGAIAGRSDNALRCLAIALRASP